MLKTYINKELDKSEMYFSGQKMNVFFKYNCAGTSNIHK